MSIFSLFKNKKLSSLDLDVKFHTDANLFGEHGTIVVSHKKKQLVEKPVRFVFAGISTPPKLDLRLLAYIWQEAQNQGYIPHHIQQYGNENEIVDTKRELARPAVSAVFDTATR